MSSGLRAFIFHHKNRKEAHRCCTVSSRLCESTSFYGQQRKVNLPFCMDVCRLGQVTVTQGVE